MGKFKLLRVGTDGITDPEAINRIVLVNSISLAVGISIIVIAPFLGYLLDWKASVMVPLVTEFVCNSLIFVLNRYKKHAAASLLLYFLQCIAITYFGFLLIRVFHLEFVVILLIAIIYLIFKETLYRRIALVAAFVVLILLEAWYYKVDAHPMPVDNYNQIFIIRTLLVISIMSITVLVSRPYVEGNDIKYELQRANKLIRIFVAQVTHELRTPLNNIHQVTQLLQKEVEGDPHMQKLRPLVDIGFVVSSNARNIVNNVLDMAGIEAGRFNTFVFEAFKVVPFFEKMLEVHRLITRRDGMQIRMETDMPEVIFGDTLNINQVLTNLLANAFKYGSQGSVITVGIKRRGDWWDLSVTNAGPGIPPDKRKAIFDPFYTSRTGRIQGSGLGLYIVKSKVEAMGGTVEVVSEPDRLTTFTVSLPLRVGKLRDLPDAMGLDAESYDLNKVYVLVAEDDKLTSFLFATYLKRMGCSFDIVKNGRELLEKAKEKCPDECPDIILLDSHMPVLNGEETIRELKEHPLLRHIPIIITTGDLFSGTVERMMSAGASTYIKKPIDHLALQKTIGLYMKKMPLN
ncbi:MAG: hybrid sensor histidine kinase/response regulator [Puia sp.]|nr:hybrid sensor histidine kinase/response regulator [Puia sp.]